jgi:hypothetical protein
MRSMQAKSFLVLFVAASLVVMLCLAGLNFRVDPFSMYSGLDRDPMLISRVEQFPHMRLSKPWAIRRFSPEAVIVGSSSVGNISPGNGSWSGLRAYNAAVPGMSSYEMLRFVEHAQAQGQLDKLMIGLDFYIYMANRSLPRQGFSEARMLRTADGANQLPFRVQQMIDTRDALFTASSLGKTLLALSGGIDGVRTYYPDGSWKNKSLRLTGKGGFQYMGRQYMAHPRDLESRLEENLDSLAQVLDLAYRENLDTRLILTPVHVFIYRLWISQGRARDWEAFHRGVLSVNRQAAERNGRDPFPVIAFNTLHGVVDEPIPGKSKKLESWFLDGVHFQAKLGELIMESAWDLDSESGVILNESGLKDYLEQVEQLSMAFDHQNADVVEQMRRKIGMP